MIHVKKGQSTLEYIILVTAVVVVILSFVGTKQGKFQNTLEKTLCSATGKMPDMEAKWNLMSGKGYTGGAAKAGAN